MSDISERYRTAAGGFTAVVESVPEGAWSNPSPCEGWTTLDVVIHLVDATRAAFERAGQPLPAGPAAGPDPEGAWSATRDAAQAALDDPAVAGTSYDGFFGPTTLESTIDQFIVGDTVIHTWDLAAAAGVDTYLDEPLLERYEEQMRALGDRTRQGGVFGPEVTPPADADVQTRVLAFTGRRAFT